MLIELPVRFNDIAWGRQSNDKPRGIIAGGMENGSLDLWSADALLDKSSNPLISQTTRHTGAIKALQFNPFKPELLATAGVGGEVRDGGVLCYLELKLTDCLALLMGS